MRRGALYIQKYNAYKGVCMLVVIRGAGDIASGIALRLFRAGMRVVMCDLPVPTSIRRTASAALKTAFTLMKFRH